VIRDSVTAIIAVCSVVEGRWVKFVEGYKIGGRSDDEGTCVSSIEVGDESINQ